MKKNMRFIRYVLLTAAITCLLGWSADLQTKEKQALEKVGTVKKKFLIYERLFSPDPALKTDCAKIQEGFSAINDEIRQGNLSLIQEHIARLDHEIDRAFVAYQERQKNAALDFLLFLSQSGVLTTVIPPVPASLGPDRSMPTPAANENRDPCQEKQDMFYQGYRAESDGRNAEAIRKYLSFLDSDCHAGADGDHARKFIAERQQRLEECITVLSGPEPRISNDMSIPAILNELELIAQADPAWAAPLLQSVRRAAAQSESKTDFPPVAGEPAIANNPQIMPAGKTPGLPLAATESRLYPLSMDVWQSAWGDFSEIDALLDYLRSNRIRQINFNPGLGIDTKSWESSKKKLAHLVGKVFGAGIERVNLLYAELAFSIENYARLLQETPSLKIDTIIDDSEFTDRNRDNFERNLAAVRRHGIRYGAFVTVESMGNSGVSDATRYWALDHADYPILMSYFSCAVDSQKATLKKYLDYADQKGRRGAVGVAILFGSKHVGREQSCEKILSGEELRIFLSQMHAWCSQHPSYGGLIIETNQRLPRWPIAIERPESEQK